MAAKNLLWLPEVSAIDSQNSREISSFGDDNDDIVKTHRRALYMSIFCTSSTGNLESSGKMSTIAPLSIALVSHPHASKGAPRRPPA
jgi:hypothetical protein